MNTPKELPKRGDLIYTWNDGSLHISRMVTEDVYEVKERDGMYYYPIKDKEWYKA